MDSKNNTQNDKGNGSTPEGDAKTVQEFGGKMAASDGSMSHHPWESMLDSYPLRPPVEDPGWAVKIVKIWLGFAIASGMFILALIVLGFFYD
jgi:hypothetical protein